MYYKKKIREFKLLDYLKKKQTKRDLKYCDKKFSYPITYFLKNFLRANLQILEEFKEEKEKNTHTIRNITKLSQIFFYKF